MCCLGIEIYAIENTIVLMGYHFTILSNYPVFLINNRIKMT